MAYTEFGELSPQARKVWAEDTMRESLGEMDIKSLIGTGPNSCIQMKGELEKGPGDTIKCDLLAQDRSDGVSGDSDLEGHETPLVYFQDELKINQKRHAHSFMAMSQQRTVHDLRKDGKYSLGQWWRWFMECGIFAHLSGVAGDGDESVRGALEATTSGETDWAGNELTALDTDHLITRPGTMDLGALDAAVARAKTLNPRVAPLMINGRKKYVCYLHPFQIHSLRTDAGATGWNEIHQNASQRAPSNPIYSGAMGEYNGVIIRESEFIPSVGNTRHGVFLGSGAALIGFGNAWKKSRRGGTSGSYFDWRENDRDYGNKEGIAAVGMLGFKRATYDGKAFGVIGINSSDAQPS